MKKQIYTSADAHAALRRVEELDDRADQEPPPKPPSTICMLHGGIIDCPCRRQETLFDMGKDPDHAD